MRATLLLTAAVCFALSMTPARCDTFTLISTPNTSYTSSTTLLQIQDALQSMVTFELQNGFSVSFLAAGQPITMDVNQVGDDWATWGPSPLTEGSTPVVLRPDDTTVKDVVFSFNQTLRTFGVKLSRMTRHPPCIRSWHPLL